MYVALTRTVLTDIDRDKVVQEVRKIRLKYPGASDDDLAKTVIRQTALRCAAIGAVASALPVSSRSFRSRRTSLIRSSL